MSREEVRFMRLLVLFDLPVKTKDDRKEAAAFRHFLIKDGYDMLQLSVYMRICRGRDAVDKHMRRLALSLPPKGCVRVLELTDRQYARMQILVGPEKPVEKVATQQLLLF